MALPYLVRDHGRYWSSCIVHLDAFYRPRTLSTDEVVAFSGYLPKLFFIVVEARQQSYPGCTNNPQRARGSYLGCNPAKLSCTCADSYSLGFVETVYGIEAVAEHTTNLESCALMVLAAELRRSLQQSKFRSASLPNCQSWGGTYLPVQLRPDTPRQGDWHTHHFFSMYRTVHDLMPNQKHAVYCVVAI